MQEPTGLTKYRTLIVLATSFLGLVLVLSGVTYFVSQKIANATKELEIASQQTLLVQQLATNLQDINLSLQELERKQAANPNAVQSTQAAPNVAQDNTQSALPEGVHKLDELPQMTIYRLEEVRARKETFAAALEALKNGGTVQDALGNTVVITPTQDPASQAMLANIESVWTPFLGLLTSLSNDIEKGVVKKTTSDYLINYIRLYNTKLQAETLDFSARRNALIQRQVGLLRFGQIGGASLALLFFAAMVFGSLRQLVRTDEELGFAKRQTDDIMKTVNEGLFLIDQDLVIADQYSAKLEEILHRDDIAGRTLYEILEGTMITQKEMETTQMFVGQLYNTWVVEELIQDLNPLKQVLLSYIDDKGESVTKFLEFNFLRVINENEEIESVFVSVVDVTNEVRLESQMQKDKEQHGREIEMIGYLLSVDNRQLIHFLDETKMRISRMNDILKEHRSSDADLRDKANQLYRETHSLKGDASAVKLSALVGLAERQEDKLNMLLMQHDLKGDDFLPVTVGLDEMMERVAFIERIVQSLNLRGEAPALMSGVQDGKQAGYWQGYFASYAKDIADRQGKMVQVRVSGFDDEALDEGVLATYKDIATQLLKNAIVHGIESTEARIAHGKDKVGRVNVSLVDDLVHQAWVLKVEDDGAGIDWGRLRQKAVEMGAYDQETAASLKPQELIKLMFVSGISTADKQDEDAGRGVGMDIVKRLAAEQGGKIGINSRPNQFTQMSITFPKTV